MTTTGTCHSQLKQELEARAQKDRSYSLRQFARDLKLSPSYLSRVLKGQKQINEARALSIAQRLDWTGKRQLAFVAMAKFSSARLPEIRAAAAAYLEQMQANAGPVYSLDLDRFCSISRWYHNAIYALAAFKSATINPIWIAKKLGISTIESELGVERLLRLGLLRKDGNSLCQAVPAFQTNEGYSAAVRAYHRSMMQKAEKALEAQSLEERQFGGAAFPISRRKLPELKARLHELMSEFVLANTDEDPDAVYHLSLQFFRLDRDEPGLPPPMRPGHNIAKTDHHKEKRLCDAQ